MTALLEITSVSNVVTAFEFSNQWRFRFQLVKMSQESGTVQSCQWSRWTFTLNNYDEAINYREYLSRGERKIKRAVFGFERGAETGTRHIQGYLELDRSYRISHVKKKFPSAHWEFAIRGALANYEYCSKSGVYDCIGDFSRENAGNCPNGARPASVALVLRGLLNDKTKPQVLASKEYADRHNFYDKSRSYIKNLTFRRQMFDKWCGKKTFLVAVPGIKSSHVSKRTTSPLDF